MTEVVRKGILEAEIQLQKANEEKLMEEVCVCVCVCVCACVCVCVCLHMSDLHSLKYFRISV